MNSKYALFKLSNLSIMTNLSKKMKVALFCFSASLFVSVAQENEPKITTDLNTLITKSSSYQNYKVIEKGAIYSFQTALNKYIEQEQNTQALLRKQILSNENEIAGLQNQMKELKNENTVLTTEKANIDFLGLSISKTSII